jgi:thymidine phosphorylase
MSPERAASPIIAGQVRARRLGFDTQHEAVVLMHRECGICRSEGLTAHNRVLLRANGRQVIATLYHVTSDLVSHDEAGLSESAWHRLALRAGDLLSVSHPKPLDSMSLIRAKIFGSDLSQDAYHAVIRDVVDGRYSDIELSALITAVAARPLSQTEIISLTNAMVDVGERLSWKGAVIADKHSVGGLPGNRTTPIVVSIVTALGLIMPKTSSRAITSPAGTADTMETLTRVDLDTADMHRVVEREGGCIVWGGAVRLSPADDILIRVERALDIDSEAQLIASVLSKKIAAGSTHVVLDMPIGPTAKVRTIEAAQVLTDGFNGVAQSAGLKIRIVAGDGTQPIGRAIGPSLEAGDVLSVLQGSPTAPSDLKTRAVQLSGALLEMAGRARVGEGAALAAQALADGRAWAKFQRICEAQGGMRVPPSSRHRRPLFVTHEGTVTRIDNRKIAKLAKLAGAPDDKAAGVELHAKVGDPVTSRGPLCTVHADAPGQLAYALGYAAANPDIFIVDER